jgi:tellurite resistance protein
MALSPEQEWTLVACGLIAHADGILEVGEWDQVLHLLDERLADDEAETWAETLADEQQLDARLEALPLPPPFFAETILEKAWRMALADGRGSEAEERVHEALASALGVEPGQAAVWRELWLERAAQRAEPIAGFAAVVANMDGRTDSEERLRFDELVDKLPVSDERREQLRGLIDAPPAMVEVIGGLAAMDPDDRAIALRSIVPVVLASSGPRERRAFLDLAEAVAVGKDEALRMLDR